MLRLLPRSTLFPYTTLFRSDEAASRLRMEIDSMPTPLDERMRRIRQLEIEREGIRRDKDAQSQERSEKIRSEEHTSELQSHSDLVCRLLLEKKKKKKKKQT